jgi:hypothetical protein
MKQAPSDCWICGDSVGMVLLLCYLCMVLGSIIGGMM